MEVWYMVHAYYSKNKGFQIQYIAVFACIKSIILWIAFYLTFEYWAGTFNAYSLTNRRLFPFHRSS